MPLSAPTSLLAGGSVNFNNNSSITAGSAFTPSNNSLVVVVIQFVRAGGSAQTGDFSAVTCSGGGYTWTQQSQALNNVLYAGDGYYDTVGYVVFTAPVTTGVSTTLSFSNTSFSTGAYFTYYNLNVYGFTGYNTSTPTGATATGTSASPGAASITLSGAPASTSVILAGLESYCHPLGATTAGTSWTSLVNVQDTNPNSVQQCQWITGVTSTSVAWNTLTAGGGFINASLFGIEIQAAGGGGNATPADCSMVFQPSANLVHPQTRDTNQSCNNFFAAWNPHPVPQQLAFWFQPPFLGPTPKSTQNTNQPFVFAPPAGAVTPNSYWLIPLVDAQRHVPTIYTAQSFVCNPTLGPPVPVDAFWTQPPDLLNHPHSLDTNQFRNDIFAGWTNNTPSSLGFFTQPQHLLRHASTLDTNQPFTFFPPPTLATPADCSFLFQPTALLNHPSTLDTNQPKDNFFTGWAQTTPTALGFWTQAPDLLRHANTIDTNQAFDAGFPGQANTTPAALGFWTPPQNLLRHAVTVDTNQGLGLFVTPAPTVPSNATIEHWSFAPIGHFTIGQGTLPTASTPTDCSFLFEPSALLKHPNTLDTNQPKDNFFAGWAQNITPTSLGFWTQAPDLVRHPTTIDTNQPRVSYQDKATPSSLGFWVQPQHLLRHPNTVDTNQPLDDAYSGWTVLTPAALGFWTQAPNLLRHPSTLDTNQALDDAFAGWTQNLTPTSFGFWTQAQNLLTHARTIDTNQPFEFNPPAPAGTPSAYWWFQPPDLLRHPPHLDTNQSRLVGQFKATPASLAFWVQPPNLFKRLITPDTRQPFVFLPPPQPPFGWLVQPQVLLRHPVPFILGGEYSFALLPTKPGANAIIKVYFFN